MKSRVQVDTMLMIVTMLFTAVLYALPKVCAAPLFLQHILDFLGYIVILKGTMLRMSARGHKKAFSEKSHSLVTTGPYKIVRNPMYLGSFLIGAGFVLILWPWWGVPLFAWVFYVRFKRQVAYEEEILSRLFGSKYTAFCHLTPRIFPTFSSMMKLRTKDIFNLAETFSTKEKFGLISWPLLALGLEYAQEHFVYHQIDLPTMMLVFSLAIVTFTVGFISLYLVK